MRTREPDFRLRGDRCLCSWTGLDLGKRARIRNGERRRRRRRGRARREKERATRARGVRAYGAWRVVTRRDGDLARGERRSVPRRYLGEETRRRTALGRGRSDPAAWKRGSPAARRQTNATARGPPSWLERHRCCRAGGAGGTRRFSVSVARAGGGGRKATELRWLTVTGCGRICEERALGGPREKRSSRRGSIALTGPRGASPHLSHRVVTVVVPTTALPWIP